MKIHDSHACHQLLRNLQEQATEMIKDEHTELSKIARVSDEAQQACRFETMLVVQPQEASIEDSSVFVISLSPKHQSNRYDDFNVYTLMIIYTVGADDLHVEFSFNSRIIEHETIHHMAGHFEQVLGKLCSFARLERSCCLSGQYDDGIGP